MKIVWRMETATVREVYEELLTRRKIAYTTVMTVMKTLEQKGHLKSSHKDRAYIYAPARPQEQVIRGMVGDFLDRVFNGAARPLLVHLLQDHRLSEKDIQEIRVLLKKETKR